MESGDGAVILKRTISPSKQVHPGNADRNSKWQVDILIQSTFKFNTLEQAFPMPLVRIEVTDIKCFSY